MKQKQRIFSLFLLVALVFSLAAPVSAAGEMNFTDVAPDDWYYTYVKDLYDNDIVHGTTPTTFSPRNVTAAQEAIGYANASREQALIMAVRMFQKL